MQAKNVKVITGEKDLRLIKFSDSKKEFTLFFNQKEDQFRDPETYRYSKAPLTDEPELKMRVEYDIQHNEEENIKNGTLIEMEKGTCECGIEREHYHCGVCGKLLRLKPNQLSK